MSIISGWKSLLHVLCFQTTKSDTQFTWNTCQVCGGLPSISFLLRIRYMFPSLSFRIYCHHRKYILNKLCVLWLSVYPVTFCDALVLFYSLYSVHIVYQYICYVMYFSSSFPKISKQKSILIISHQILLTPNNRSQ